MNHGAGGPLFSWFATRPIMLFIIIPICDPAPCPLAVRGAISVATTEGAYTLPRASCFRKCLRLWSAMLHISTLRNSGQARWREGKRHAAGSVSGVAAPSGTEAGPVPRLEDSKSWNAARRLGLR